MALNVVVGVDVGIGMCVSVGILSQYEHEMSQRKLTRSSQGATWELVTVVGNIFQDIHQLVFACTLAMLINKSDAKCD